MTAPAQVDWPLKLALRLGLHDARIPPRPGFWERLRRRLGGEAPPVNVATAPYVAKANVFFLHIPKSGGTSFDAFLSTFFSVSKVLPVELQYLGWKWNRGEPSPFRYIHLATEYDAYRDRLPWLHFVTLLRDPAKRILSDYWYHRQQYDYGKQIAEVASEYQPRWDAARGLSLDEWSRIPAGQEGAYPRNLNLATLTCGVTKLQGLGSSAMSRLLRRAKQTLQNDFSFVGITEEYARSKELFCRTFGLPPDFATGEERRNVAATDSRREPPAEETLRRIRAENAWDLELYEFARELFTTRYEAFQATPWDDLTTIRISPDDDRYPREAGFLRLEAARLRGSGLYREEVNPSGWTHRWTGGLPETRIHFGAKLPIGAELTVRLELAAVLDEETWNTLRVTLDGVEACGIERSHGPGRLFFTSRYRVTRDLASRPLHGLVLHSHRGRPAQSGGDAGDDRQLGVAIQEVFIEWTRSATRQLAGGQPPEGLGPPRDELIAADTLAAV